MILNALKTIVLFLALGASTAHAVDDLQDEWIFDLSFLYSRMERTTVNDNINFLSRNGAMIAVEMSQKYELFRRLYFGADFANAFYEAPGTAQLNPENQNPWQIYFGTGFRVGDSRDLEYFFGLGFSTEYFQRLIGPDSYSLDRTHSVRAHAGMSYRFISMTGTNAKAMLRLSYPVTPVEHFGSEITYAGVIDATLRLQFSYRSPWSLTGGLRFEDYKVSDKSVTYFNTRVHAGFGLHF